MSERHDWEPIPTDEAINRLAEADLLTRRQAEAYVLREIEAVPRQAAAKQMGISKNTLDNRLGEARRKVEAAEDTLEEIETIRHRPIPDECAECGTSLAGEFATIEGEGQPLCFECAGVEPSDI